MILTITPEPGITGQRVCRFVNTGGVACETVAFATCTRVEPSSATATTQRHRPRPNTNYWLPVRSLPDTDESGLNAHNTDDQTTASPRSTDEVGA